MAAARCAGDEILITDTVASELGLSIGDPVQVASGGRRETYTVSGIYQCANGMGSNIGMSLAGYSKIGDVTGFIWCTHYILENGGVRDYAMAYLQQHYRGIDVHTNSWSGLSGIVRAMHGLIAAIYGIAACFVLVAVLLSAGRLLRAEAGRMALYKSLGLSTLWLRMTFALRFLLAAVPGVLAGLLASALWADAAVGSIFRRFGIGAFRAGPGVLAGALPLVAVPALFFGFAFGFSARLKRVSIRHLLTENTV